MRKLSCATVRKVIGASRTEDWPTGLRPLLEEHLRTCVRCRQALAEFNVIGRAMRDCEPDILPPDFASAVMRRISERTLVRGDRGQVIPTPWPTTLFARDWRPVAVAALLVVILIGTGALALRIHGPALDSPGGDELMSALGLSHGRESAVSETAFLEDLAHYHQRFSETSRGVDAGILLVSGQM